MGKEVGVEPKDNLKTVEYSDEVVTALRTIDRYRTIRNEKDIKVNRARLMYDIAFGSGELTRLNSLPGYILNMVVELFVTLAQVPDFRLNVPEATDEEAILMSAYLEHKVRKGGFHDLMETGWSGFHELALTGTVNVQGGVKTEEYWPDDEIGDPLYQMIPCDNNFYNPTATRIRINTTGGDAYRYGFLDSFELDTADEQYPGIMDVCAQGDIPSALAYQKDDELTDEQRAEKQSKPYIQVLRFFDRIAKIDLTIGGSNAGKINLLTGEEYDHQLFGRDIVPTGIANFFPKTKGIEGVGAGEMFYPVAKAIDDISSSQLNNTVDNYNAPAIISINDVTAEKVFAQLEMAKQKRLKGESSFMAFDPKNGQAGQNQVDYIRNEFPYEDTKAIIEKCEVIIRRLGFNLDLFFTDAAKTLGQTEFDIQGTNSTISKIIGRNTDFWQYIFRHGGETITENGDVNNDKPFGQDLELEIEGEQVKVKELTGGITTEGEIIQMFKDYEYTIEIDTKTGVRFNDKLEERYLTRRLEKLAPGSQEYLNTLNALAFLKGGKRINKDDLLGPEGAAPAGQGGGQAQLETGDSLLQ